VQLGGDGDGSEGSGVSLRTPVILLLIKNLIEDISSLPASWVI